MYSSFVRRSRVNQQNDDTATMKKWWRLLMHVISSYILTMSGNFLNVLLVKTFVCTHECVQWLTMRMWYIWMRDSVSMAGTNGRGLHWLPLALPRFFGRGLRFHERLAWLTLRIQKAKMGGGWVWLVVRVFASHLALRSRRWSYFTVAIFAVLSPRIITYLTNQMQSTKFICPCSTLWWGGGAASDPVAFLLRGIFFLNITSWRPPTGSKTIFRFGSSYSAAATCARPPPVSPDMNASERTTMISSVDNATEIYVKTRSVPWNI